MPTGREQPIHGFVHKASGRKPERTLPSANTAWMALAPEQVARWADSDGANPMLTRSPGR